MSSSRCMRFAEKSVHSGDPTASLDLRRMPHAAAIGGGRGVNREGASRTAPGRTEASQERVTLVISVCR